MTFPGETTLGKMGEEYDLHLMLLVCVGHDGSRMTVAWGCNKRGWRESHELRRQIEKMFRDGQLSIPLNLGGKVM